MKIALVTGASRGLGKGLAETLALKGYFVYAGHRTPGGLTDTKNIAYLQLDVRHDESITMAIAEIKKRHGKINLLINNAGVGKDGGLGGDPDETTKLGKLNRRVLNEMFNVNAVSPLIVAQYAVSLMTEADSYIVNISSDRASFADDTNTSAHYGYRASKVALNMLTQCLLFDLPKNVSAIAVHPGWVLTDMNTRGFTSPSQAAEEIISLTENFNPQLNGRFVRTDGSLLEL